MRRIWNCPQADPEERRDIADRLFGKTRPPGRNLSRSAVFNIQRDHGIESTEPPHLQSLSDSADGVCTTGERHNEIVALVTLGTVVDVLCSERLRPGGESR